MEHKNEQSNHRSDLKDIQQINDSSPHPAHHHVSNLDDNTPTNDGISVTEKPNVYRSLFCHMGLPLTKLPDIGNSYYKNDLESNKHTVRPILHNIGVTEPNNNDSGNDKIDLKDTWQLNENVFHHEGSVGETKLHYSELSADECARKEKQSLIEPMLHQISGPVSKIQSNENGGHSDLKDNCQHVTKHILQSVSCPETKSQTNEYSQHECDVQKQHLKRSVLRRVGRHMGHLVMKSVSNEHLVHGNHENKEKHVNEGNDPRQEDLLHVSKHIHCNVAGECPGFGSHKKSPKCGEGNGAVVWHVEHEDEVHRHELEPLLEEMVCKIRSI